MADKRSIIDILRLNANLSEDWEVIKTEYIPVDIDKVVIDGDTFTNYGDFSFVWEKSFLKEPDRAGDGSLRNLNGYATFVVPHLVIDFSVMSIDDYRAIVRKDLEKNEFVVECYDPIYNKRITQKMYFATLEMAKLMVLNRTRFNGEAWEDFLLLAGVRDYSIEMVGTKSDLDLVSVVYHLNPPANTGRGDETIGEEDVYKGQEIVIGGASDFQQETFGGVYKFTKWNINPEGGVLNNYLDGYAYTINTDLVLYAQWEEVNSHTLSFSYGLADPAIHGGTNTYEMTRTVRKGSSIGNLPLVETPYVELEGTRYYPYTNGAWYKTAIKGNKSTEVKSGDIYWADRSTSIYLLYETKTYALNLYLEGELYQSNNIEYNTPMNLPNLVKKGYTFDGWYKSAEYKKGEMVSGNMPPYNLSLYARWIENKE